MAGNRLRLCNASGWPDRTNEFAPEKGLPCVQSALGRVRFCIPEYKQETVLPCLGFAPARAPSGSPDFF